MLPGDVRGDAEAIRQPEIENQIEQIGIERPVGVPPALRREASFELEARISVDPDAVAQLGGAGLRAEHYQGAHERRRGTAPPQAHRASYEAKVIAVSSLCSFLKSLGLDAVRLERAGALRARAALRDVWSPILSPPWTEPPR